MIGLVLGIKERKGRGLFIFSFSDDKVNTSKKIF